MTDIRLRPRFDRALRCSKKDAMDMMRSTLEDPDVHIRCSVFRNSCVLKVPLDDVRFWSPQLQLSIEEKSDEEAQLHGIYGPRPAVWSIFIAAYSAIAFLGMMGMIYGYSQWSIGEPAPALWSGPVALIVALVVWIIGRFGRSRGMSQMLMLRDVMLRAIGAQMDE